MRFHLAEYPSPLGTIIAVGHQDKLIALDFDDTFERFEALLKKRFGPYELLHEADILGMEKRLDAYFAGEAFAFEGLALQPQGTPFQQQVWRTLQEIPWGQTWSYGQLAQAVATPKAARAVGAANGQNPIGIIIPCHRVIGANNKLTGYAGGLERKAWLLRHEGALALKPEQPSLF